MKFQENEHIENLRKVIDNQPSDGGETKQIKEAQEELIKILDEQIDAKKRLIAILKNAINKATETK